MRLPWSCVTTWAHEHVEIVVVHATTLNSRDASPREAKQSRPTSGIPVVSPTIGRKIPREGGIIIAVGKNRAEIERIVREDPFHEHGLADFRIIEFRASQRADDMPSRIAAG